MLRPTLQLTSCYTSDFDFCFVLLEVDGARPETLVRLVPMSVDGVYFVRSLCKCLWVFG